MTNFSYTKQYDKIIQYIGWFPFYDEEFIIGDPKNLDFITFYSLKNDVIEIIF